jgi:hypothetical protein
MGPGSLEARKALIWAAVAAIVIALAIFARALGVL